jgi:hypothetical protein
MMSGLFTIAQQATMTTVAATTPMASRRYGRWWLPGGRASSDTSDDT